VDVIEEATAELHLLCLAAVADVVRRDRFANSRSRPRRCR
jgi:glutathionylspermidine synthase